MKARLNVARSLLHGPELLFWDEPTAGLDPTNARRIKDLALAQKGSGRTIFLTTHDMTLADELCDRVAFLVDGTSPPSTPRGSSDCGTGGGSSASNPRPTAGSSGGSSRWTAWARNPDFLALLRSGGVRSLHSQEATLEDVFLRVTGRSLSMRLRRLAAAMAGDIRLQYRNGFYAAAAFVAVVLVLMIRWVPREYLGWLMPALVLTNMQVNTFYFLGGLVLLEKGEGSLEALVVTPLRRGEYLASKVLTLALLSLVEALAIVLLTHGPRFDPWAFAAGIALSAALFCLYGFLVVARYDSINEYLFPSMVYTAVLPLPLLDYFEVWETPLVYLHPIQAPLVLLEAAFRPVSAWEVAYGILYGGLWVAVMGVLAARAFGRFIVAREGVR